MFILSSYRKLGSDVLTIDGIHWHYKDWTNTLPQKGTYGNYPRFDHHCSRLIAYARYTENQEVNFAVCDAFLAISITFVGKWFDFPDENKNHVWILTLRHGHPQMHKRLFLNFVWATKTICNERNLRKQRNRAISKSKLPQHRFLPLNLNTLGNSHFYNKK